MSPDRPIATARICIAIPTYARPQALDRLLGSLQSLVIPTACELEAVVLDNDRQPSAETLVAQHARQLPFVVHYRHIPAPGLAAVRNAALAFGSVRFDYLAMIDDDEVPVPHWLYELVRVQRASGADAIHGPVPSRLPASAPTWLSRGHFFEPKRYRDGETMSDGYSGNCLLSIGTIARLRIAFDTTFNFAGGEDLIFFRDLIRGGGRLVYAAGAIAHEDIEANRCRASYVIRLYFRRGNTLSRSDLRTKAGPRNIALRLLKANARLGLGIATFLPRYVLRGWRGMLEAGCDIALGLGALAGLFGYTYEPYRRPT